MSQIVLIEDNQTISNLLGINLSTYTGSEIIPRENAKDATQLLDILPSIDIIVARDRIGEEETASILLNYIKEKNMDYALIIFGEKVPQHEKGDLVHIKNRAKWEDVIDSAKTILGIDDKKLAEMVLPEYISIPIHYFYSIESTPL